MNGTGADDVIWGRESLLYDSVLEKLGLLF